MPQTIKAINKTNNNELAVKMAVAESLFSRMKGLLGKKSLFCGEGLWIKPCKGVHTFGMQFPIDVVFLDSQCCVIAVAKSLPPNRMTRLFVSAASVLELPSGTVEQTATGIGDRINFC